MKRFLSLIAAAALLLCAVCVSGVKAEAASASGENGVWLDFATATDEELEEAAAKIRAEQRARIKTRISFSAGELSVAKGKTAEISAEVTDVPEGVKAGRISWASSDAKVAVYQQGKVKGLSNGTAVLTASCTLSDGTVVQNECPVTVYTPVTGLSASAKSYSIGVGESVQTRITVQPKDASVTALEYESSNPLVAVVSEDGVITGVGAGKAEIRASAPDGSGIGVSFSVTVTKKDDRGVTKSDSASRVTLIGFSETNGKSYATPDSGKIFVLVEFEIENTSSDDLAISSILSFTGYCDGYTLDYSFSATLNTSRQMDGTISPGKKMRGQVGFEVPRNWKELEVHVRTDYWRGSDLEFVLFNQ